MSEDQAPAFNENSSATASEASSEGNGRQPLSGATAAATNGMLAGASDARAAAAKVASVTGRMLTQTIYSTCYCLSYGVAFPTLLGVGLIPKNNPLYSGFVDGANAAQELVEEMHSRRARRKQTAADAIRSAEALPAVPALA